MLEVDYYINIVATMSSTQKETAIGKEQTKNQLKIRVVDSKSDVLQAWIEHVRDASHSSPQLISELRPIPPLPDAAPVDKQNTSEPLITDQMVESYSLQTFTQVDERPPPADQLQSATTYEGVMLFLLVIVAVYFYHKYKQ